MIINLFSIFDGSTYYLNTRYSRVHHYVIFFVICTSLCWIQSGGIILRLKSLSSALTKEFYPLLNQKAQIFILPFYFSLFVFFAGENIHSLFPEVFGPHSQLKYRLIGLFIWLTYVIYCWRNFLENFYSHIIPYNTPIFLIHFMVLVEIVRNIIRPFTLAIRITANLTAGHLILSLISSSLPLLGFNILLLERGLVIIIIMELAVRVIQAYIFRVLLLLYFIDINK